MKGIVEISERGIHLSVSTGWLIIKQNGKKLGEIPFEDIEVMLISEVSTSLTTFVVAECTARNIPIVFCDKTYKPSCIALPMFGNVFVTDYLFKQIAVSQVQRKRCWRAIVKQKILNSAVLLGIRGKNDALLLKYARKVKSGDSKNMEAMAARIFWDELALFPKRDRGANDANCLLNYAYMVVFGMMACAVCSAGLNPSLGVNHRNKLNPFCLVSDLIEPYRYIAEIAVIDWLAKAQSCDVTKEAKLSLLREIKNSKIEYQDGIILLSEALKHTAVSYRDLLDGDLSKLFLPRFLYSKGIQQCG